GMPRRVYTYGVEMGWGDLNLVATIGAMTIALSILLFIVNVWRSLRHGERAPANPWNAGTLEWSVASPPPACNFEAAPVVGGRDPLWEPGGIRGHVAGLAIDSREVLTTTVLDAEPETRESFSEPTIWPFIGAVATTVFFIGTIFTPWAVAWGSVPVAIALTLWFWPQRRENQAHLALERAP
ncbi:MAG: cytochrome ubiquinol oxidase subunit I, partial [Rhizobacter sp.]|nr:cytochrome ubiquinol oxidase subunit I [Rhizobacter sp.]